MSTDFRTSMTENYPLRMQVKTLANAIIELQKRLNALEAILQIKAKIQ